MPAAEPPEQSEPMCDIIFRANLEGDLSISVDWPDASECPPSHAAQLMATMMHQISTGTWKGVMVKAIQAHGIDINEQEMSQAILEHWSGMVQTQRNEALCVDPTSVFRGTNPNE